MKKSEGEKYKKYCLAEITRKYNELKKGCDISATQKYFIRISYKKIKKCGMPELRKNMMITKLVEKIIQALERKQKNQLRLHQYASYFIGASKIAIL